MVAATSPSPKPNWRPFTARTSNVYSVPSVSPVTVWLVVVGPLPSMSSHIVDAETDGPASWRTWNFVISSPLCHGVSHVRSIAPTLSPGLAARLPGASGAVGVRLLYTSMSVNDSTSLSDASFSGFDAGFV